MRILNSTDEIPRRPSGDISKDEQRTLKNVREQIKPSEIERGAGGIILVRFFTWDELGGVVSQNTVALLADARVSLSRSTLATRVGAYKRIIGRM
jgi:hypothetical protein